MMYDYKLHLVIRPHGLACGSSQTTFDTANPDYRALTAYKGDGTAEGLRMYLYRNGTYETSYTRLEIDYSPALDSKNAVNLSTLTAWDSKTLS